MDFLGLTRIPIYSLDLSDRSFKFLRLVDSPKGVTVANFGEGSIDKGVLANRELVELFDSLIMNSLNEDFVKA